MLVAEFNDQFSALEGLSLSRHGDALERFYWPMLAHAVPSYELFWKYFVVLLTNRVIPFAGFDRVALRTGIPHQYQELLMANYTTFYHFAVAHELIVEGQRALESGGFNHPELFFFSLKASLESCDVLREKALRLLAVEAIKTRYPSLPEEAVNAIKTYRNVFTHRSLMGRGRQHGRPFIPKVEYLPQSRKQSLMPWSETMALGQDGMTDSIALQEHLWTEISCYLNGTWQALAGNFAFLRNESSFISTTGLEDYLPIFAEIADVEASAASRYAASGALIPHD